MWKTQTCLFPHNSANGELKLTGSALFFLKKKEENPLINQILSLSSLVPSAPKVPILERGRGQGKGQPWLHPQGRRSNTSAVWPGCQVLFRASLHLPVPTVHCGVSDDILLVHAGVIALLTLVGLAAYMVEHVLLQEAGRVP